MSESALKRLEKYKKKYNLSDKTITKRLGVYYNYLYRWRKAGRIIGIYEKVVEEFLKKEK